MKNLKLILFFTLLSAVYLGAKAADNTFYITIDGIKYSLHYGFIGEPNLFPEEYVNDPLNFEHYAVVEGFETFDIGYYIPDYVEYDSVIYPVSKIDPNALIFRDPPVGLNVSSHVLIPGGEVSALYIRDFEGLLNYMGNYSTLTEVEVPFAAQYPYYFKNLSNLHVINTTGRETELYVDYSSMYGSYPLRIINIGPCVSNSYGIDTSGCEYLQTINCMALTPPEFRSTDEPIKLFSDEYFNTIELNVPVGKGDIYRNDPVWGQFTNIKECLDLKGNIIYAWEEVDGIVYGVSDTDCAALYLNNPEQEYANIQNYVIINGQYYEVTRIGAGAFMHTGIREVSIPEGIKEIDDLAFYECPNLYNYDNPKIYLPESLERIGDLPFEGCSIYNHIPSNLKWVGARGLRSLSIPYHDDLEPVILPEGLEYLGDEALYMLFDAVVSVPSSLKETGLRSIVFSGTTQYKADVIFNNNVSSLANLTNQAIQYFPVKEITIPSGIKNISNVFGINSKSLTIGKDVEVIQGRFIADDLYMLPENPPRIWEKFVIDNPFGTVHVKKGCLANYLNSPLWSRLDKIVDDIDFAEDGEFSYQLNWTQKTATLTGCLVENRELVIPATVAHAGETFSVTTIGTHAVKHETSSTTLPETIKHIQNLAFENYNYYQDEVICYAQTPPSIASYFSLAWPAYTGYLWHACYTLYVPDGTVDLYADSYFGSMFREIKELGSLSVTNVENVACSGGPVEIFNINGISVYKGSTANANLPKGIYIVKQNDKTYKIVR